MHPQVTPGEPFKSFFLIGCPCPMLTFSLASHNCQIRYSNLKKLISLVLPLQVE